MDDGPRAYSRIRTAHGSNYLALEKHREVVDRVVEAEAVGDPFILITTYTAQPLLPPEEMLIRAKDVVAVQAVSDPGWIWDRRANELHYAQQMAQLEQNPSDRYAAAMEKMTQILSGEEEDE
jgi:hypothetical protein